jgi:alpha-1,2-mannosyltransferase
MVIGERPRSGTLPGMDEGKHFSLRRLSLFVVAIGLGLNVVLTAISMVLLRKNLLPPRQVTSSLSSLMFYFLRGHQGKDSWVPMMGALNVFYAHLPVYKTVFFLQKIKFQYPISSLLPFHAMRSAGIATHTIFSMMNVLTWLSVWVIAGFSFLILLDGLRRQGVQLTQRDRWLLCGTSILACLTFYPVVKGYSLGQVQTILSALFAAAVWAWLRKRETTAGFLIGLMCLMKPQYVLIPVWFGLRKRWGAFAASLAVNGIGLIAAVAVFGWREQLDYLNVLSFMSKHGETYFANQSVNGLLHRLLFQGDNAIFQNHTFAPYSTVVYVLTLASSLLFVVATLYFRKGKGDQDRTEDLLRVALVATMASPIVWEHHYGIALAIFAYLLGRMTTAWELRALAVSFALLGTSWTPMSAFAYVPVLNLLQSLSFLGALLLLGLMFRIELADIRARGTAAIGGMQTVNDAINPQYG